MLPKVAASDRYWPDAGIYENPPLASEDGAASSSFNRWRIFSSAASSASASSGCRALDICLAASASVVPQADSSSMPTPSLYMPIFTASQLPKHAAFQPKPRLLVLQGVLGARSYKPIHKFSTGCLWPDSTIRGKSAVDKQRERTLADSATERALAAGLLTLAVLLPAKDMHELLHPLSPYRH